MTKEELQAAVDAVPYWYHRIELPYGITTPGWAPLDASKYRIPQDLTGKTVLDVGAWDGYWTFEAIKRGADVVAIEDFSDTIGGRVNANRQGKWDTFDLCRDAMGLTDGRCWRIESSVYNLPNVSEWCPVIADTFQAISFDAIFCFGLLYHLKHPLQALEILRAYCRGTIHIETAILDGLPSVYGRSYSGDECSFEFYPGAEYGANPSNWWVGTLKAWCGLVEAAGFRDIEYWKLTDNPQSAAEQRGFIRARV